MTDSAPKHPGKILFDQVMTPLGVSRNKLARDIDVPVGRISDIVAGKRGVTPDTALRFSKYFGTTAELWLRLQADYDLYVARTTTWQDAEPKVSVFEPAAGAAADIPSAPQSQPAMSSSEAGSSDPVSSDPVGATAGDAVPVVPGMAATPEDNDLAVNGTDADDGDIDIPEPVGLGGSRPEGA